MTMGFFIRDQMENDSALMEMNFRTVNHREGMNERGNPTLHIRCPTAVNPSLVEFSPKRRKLPFRGTE
jgi:hypothetical protein